MMLPPGMPGTANVASTTAKTTAASCDGVSVTHLHGVYLVPHDTYAWLRDREPIATLGWSIYVYDLSDEPDVHCRLAALYTAARDTAYATAEQRRCDARRRPPEDTDDRPARLNDYRFRNARLPWRSSDTTSSTGFRVVGP